MKKAKIRAFTTLIMIVVLLGATPVRAYTSYEDSTLPREIVVASSNENYPFHFADVNGNPAGINIDFWNLWSEKTGVKVKYLMSDWETSLRNMKEKKADVHAGCFYTEERDSYLEYGTAITEAETHLFYHSSLKGIDRVEDAVPYTIGVIKGDYAESYIKTNLKEASVKTYTSYEDMIDAANSGAIKVFVADTLTALAVMREGSRNSEFTFKKDSPLYTNYFYIAAQEGQTKFINNINEGMSKISLSEKSAIMEKWLPKGEESRKTVRVTLSPDYPPFSYPDDYGNPQGMLVDLWRLWGEKAGYNVAFIMTSWSDTINMVGTGNAEIHSGLFKTEERSQLMDFSRPFYSIESAVFYNSKLRKYTSMQDLTGKAVGANRDSYQEAFMRENYPDVRLVSFDSSNSMVEAAENGLIDGFIEETVSIKGAFQVSERPFNNVALAEPHFVKEMMAGIEKGNSELLKDVNRGLDLISVDEWRGLEERWITDSDDRQFLMPAALTLTEDQKKWIADHPVLKVGADRFQNPVEYLENGEAKGIAADYMRYILTRIGIKGEMEFRSWSEILKGIEPGGDLDLSFNIQKTDKRASSLEFSKPFIRIPHVVVTQGERKLVNTLNDLSGLTVAVESDYYKNDHFLRNKAIRILSVDNAQAGLLAVSTGRADAYVGDRLTVSHFIASDSLKNLRVSDYMDLGTYNISVGFRKELAPLKDIINQVLDTMSDYEKKAILSKYTTLSEEGAISLTDAETIWLRNHTPIRTGFLTGWAPVDYIDETGSTAGVSSDYSARIERNLSVQLEPVTSASYAELINMMRTGKLDIIMAAVKSPDKSKYMDFTKPYMRSPIALITLDASNFTGGIESVSRERVGVIAGSYPEDILIQDYPMLDYRGYVDTESLYRGLESGEVDLIMDSMVGLDYVSRLLAINDLRVSSVTGYVSEVCIGVRKDWSITLQVLNKLIDAISPIEKESTEQYWISKRPPEKQNWDKYKPIILGGGGVTVIIIAMILFWNQKLQNEINRRRRIEAQLKAAKELADEANRSKSEFLANMSHEIRTPMNAVIGMATLLGRTDLDWKQKDYLNKIVQAAYNLLGIINDILDFSKIEAGKMSIESVEFDLEGILGNVANIIGVRAKDKNVELVISKDSNVPVSLIGDPLRLEQILVNLMNNAVKFTHDGEVVIHIRSDRRDSERVYITFSVKDTGIGMAEESLSNLFKPFTQSDTSTTRKFGGTGLGLSISKNLVELMGGRIWAMCSLGGGCEFSFELPFQSIEGMDTSRAFNKGELEGLKVLVVEDNPTAREVMEAYLKDFNLSADATDSGEDALIAVGMRAYDLVLLDWKLGGIDGLETAKRIRNQELGVQPKIVIVTAYGESEELESCKEDGIDGILLKPISESALFNEIQNLFSDNHDAEYDLYNTAKLNEHFLEGRKILVVEDNAMNQQLARELLESVGAKVDIANNGYDAIVQLQNPDTLYDIILMDLQMPEMDGFEATEKIRSMEAWADIPIISMTADVLPGILEKCIEQGMNDYVSKPISVETLYEKLGFWMGIEQPYYLQDAAKKQGYPKLTDVDSAVAIKNLGGNVELYIQILERFVETYVDFAEKAEQMIRLGDPSEYQRLFHTLKGHGGSIGSDKLFKLAQRAEVLAKEGHKEEMPPLIDEIIQMLSVIRDEFGRYVVSRESRADTKQLWTIVELAPVLDDLKSALSKRKPAEVQEKLSVLLTKEAPVDFIRPFKAMVTFCERYKYREAAAAVDEIIAMIRG